MKQYKAISGPQTIDVNSHENISEAAEKYEKFVNEQAAAGWEYHSASTIIVNKKGGCLRKDSAAKYKMMIFAREGTEGSAPLAENEDHSQVSFETANTENTTDTATHASNKKWIFIVLACLLVVLIGVVVYNLLCGRALIAKKPIAIEINTKPDALSKDEALRYYLEGLWAGSSTTKIRFFSEELKVEYIEKTWSEPVTGSYYVEDETLVIQLKVEKPEGIRNYELVADCKNLTETGSFYLECFVDLPWHPETFNRTFDE